MGTHVTSERRLSQHALQPDGDSMDPSLSESSKAQEPSSVKLWALRVLLSLSHVGASFEAAPRRAVEYQNCDLRSEVGPRLLAPELFQGAGDSGTTQRAFQELLTGATGSYLGQQKMLLGVLACSSIQRSSHQELGPLASPVPEGHEPQKLEPSIAISNRHC